MKKQLEDRYIVIKKADVDASALNCLIDHLDHNAIPRRTGMFVELHHDVYPQVRNLCLYGTVYGPDMSNGQELDSETITTQTCGDLTSTVTERVFRSKPGTATASLYALGHHHEDVSPEVTRHQASQLGAPVSGCQAVQPIGYRCTRAFMHDGPCAAERVGAAPTVPKPPSDLDMYAYYIQNGLTDYALKIEEAHLLVGYPPECVTVGLAAIEEGKDPIYAIQCYTEKSQAPMPVPPLPTEFPAPIGWKPGTAPVCASGDCMSPAIGASDRCFRHASAVTTEAPMPPPQTPAPEAPVFGCDTCKDSGLVLAGTKRERRCSDCVS